MAVCERLCSPGNRQIMGRVMDRSEELDSSRSTVAALEIVEEIRHMGTPEGWVFPEESGDNGLALILADHLVDYARGKASGLPGGDILATQTRENTLKHLKVNPPPYAAGERVIDSFVDFLAPSLTLLPPTAKR